MNYEYGKIRTLNESLEKNMVDKKIIDKIMHDGEKIKQTDKNQVKAEWLYHAMQKMDSELSDEIKYKIRTDCACSLGGARNKTCVKINKNYASIEDRLKAATESKIFGVGVKEIDQGKYQVLFFPEEWEKKPCPCIKGLNEKMPVTYCYCCGGHVKFHLETILGKKLKVEVMETSLTSLGAKNCNFVLTEMPE